MRKDATNINVESILSKYSNTEQAKFTDIFRAIQNDDEATAVALMDVLTADEDLRFEQYAKDMIRIEEESLIGQSDNAIEAAPNQGEAIVHHYGLKAAAKIKGAEDSSSVTASVKKKSGNGKCSIL
jgi:hypothetical protein